MHSFVHIDVNAYKQCFVLFSPNKVHGVRQKLVKLFQERFSDSGLCFVIG